MGQPSFSTNRGNAGINVANYFVAFNNGAFTGSTSTEAQVKQAARAAGIFRYVTVRIPTNGLGGTSTGKFRKNGADGTGAVSIPAAATGWFIDTSGTDTVTAGDLYNFGLTQPGGGVIRIQAAGVTSVATTGAVSYYGEGHGGADSSVINADAAQDQVYPLLAGPSGGSDFWDGTTANYPRYSPVIRGAGTLSNHQVRVVSSNRTGITTVGTYINGVKGNIAVSIPAASTGLFEDTSHSDTIASGDVVCAFATTTADTSKTIRFDFQTIMFTAANGFAFELFGQVRSGAVESNGSDSYYGFGHALADNTESNTQFYMPYGFVSTHLRINYPNHSSSGAITHALRINGADANQSISVPSGNNPGIYEDTTHSDTIAAGDLVCMRSAHPTGISILQWWALGGTLDAPASLRTSQDYLENVRTFDDQATDRLRTSQTFAEHIRSFDNASADALRTSQVFVENIRAFSDQAANRLRLSQEYVESIRTLDDQATDRLRTSQIYLEHVRALHDFVANNRRPIVIITT